MGEVVNEYRTLWLKESERRKELDKKMKALGRRAQMGLSHERIRLDILHTHKAELERQVTAAEGHVSRSYERYSKRDERLKVVTRRAKTVKRALQKVKQDLRRSMEIAVQCGNLQVESKQLESKVADADRQLEDLREFIPDLRRRIVRESERGTKLRQDISDCSLYLNQGIVAFGINWEEKHPTSFQFYKDLLDKALGFVPSSPLPDGRLLKDVLQPTLYKVMNFELQLRKHIAAKSAALKEEMTKEHSETMAASGGRIQELKSTNESLAAQLEKLRARHDKLRKRVTERHEVGSPRGVRSPRSVRGAKPSSSATKQGVESKARSGGKKTNKSKK